jgi:DNA transposition AAA+ family ATPase
MSGRILSSDRPEDVTVEDAERVIAAARQYLSDARVSQSYLAKLIGMSPASLSMFLEHRAGDWQSIALELDAALAERAHRTPAAAPVVRTRVVKQILGVAGAILERPAIGMVHGGAGIGKTTALEHLRSEIPGCLYFVAATAQARPKGMLMAIAEAMGRYCAAREMAVVYTNVCREMERYRYRLFMIDEAHRYMGRGEDCFEVLRDVFDRTGIPQLWVGTKDLRQHFNRRVERDDQPLAQIVSRTSVAVSLNDLAEDGGTLFDSREIRELLASFRLKPDTQAMRLLVQFASLIDQGGIRAMLGLYRSACTLADKAGAQQVTLEHLDMAQQISLDKKSYLTVRARMREDQLAATRHAHARREAV